MTAATISKSDAKFRNALAIALRSNPEIWRLRRTDQFSPIDLNSARHRVTLQFLITADFVNNVIRADQRLNGECSLTEEGESLTVYLPVLRMPKRILVDFKTTDVAGHGVPLLPRTHDSLIVAEALVESFDVTRDDKRYEPLKILLASLIYLNPVSLLFAVSAWARSNRIKFAHGDDLSDEHLEEWMATQAEYLKESMGWATVNVMHRVLQEDPVGALGIPFRPRQTQVRRDPVGYFPTLAHLACYGIHDVLRCVDDWAASAAPETRTELERQMRGTQELVEELYLEGRLDPPAVPDWDLLAKVQDSIPPGLRYLRRVCETDDGAMKRILEELESWTPFVIADVVLGKPTVMQIEERLPLGDWHPLPGEKRKRIRRPHEQYYPIVISDAPSLHLEVQLDDPELRIPLRAYVDGWIRGRFNRRVRIVGFDPTKGRLGFGGQTNSPTGALFEAEARTSARLLHFYTSFRRGDARYWDELENLHLAIPIRLTWLLKGAMFSLATALTVAAAFVGGQVWPTAVIEGHHLALSREVITTSALSVTVGVWSVQWQNPTPLVARKLRLFRWWIMLALAVIVISTGAYLVASVYRNGLPTGETQSHGTVAPFSPRDTWWLDHLGHLDP